MSLTVTQTHRSVELLATFEPMKLIIDRGVREGTIHSSIPGLESKDEETFLHKVKAGKVRFKVEQAFATLWEEFRIQVGQPLADNRFTTTCRYTTRLYVPTHMPTL